MTTQSKVSTMANTQRPTKASFVPARFDLVDHNGNRVTNESYFGNYVLVFFGFTHCKMVCREPWPNFLA